APAVTERRLGRGSALFIATYAALSFNELEDEATRRLILRCFEPSGFPCVTKLKVGSKKELGRPFSPVVRILETADDYLVVVSNHMDAEVAIELGIDRGGGLVEQVVLCVPASDGIVHRVRRSG
ncbi:MAG: hypothetical protein WCL50_09925, partial [Spirochaetota bacterium]